MTTPDITPAPQDTAEAMAEVERCISIAISEATIAGEFGEGGFAQHWAGKAMASVRAIVDRATIAEAALASLRAEQEVLIEEESAVGTWNDLSITPLPKRSPDVIVWLPKDEETGYIAHAEVCLVDNGEIEPRDSYGPMANGIEPSHWAVIKPPRTRISAQKDRADGGRS